MSGLSSHLQKRKCHVEKDLKATLPKHWINIFMTAEWLEHMSLPRSKASRVTDMRLLKLDSQATHAPPDFRQRA